MVFSAMKTATTSSKSMLDLVNETAQLPTSAEAVAALHCLAADDAATVDDVVAMIAIDPGLATNLLRHASRGAAAGPRATIPATVMRLGAQAAATVAATAPVCVVPAGLPAAALDLVGLQRHSVFTAVAARALGRRAPRLEGIDPQCLYECGLLHDIGKLLMITGMPEAYVAVVNEASRSRRTELQVEREILGYHHAKLGGVLAIKWNLAEDLTIAIRYHHEPASDPFHQTLSSLVHVADHLAWSSGNPSIAELAPPELDVEVYSRLGLDASRVEQWLPEICDDFAALAIPL